MIRQFLNACSSALVLVCLASLQAQAQAPYPVAWVDGIGVSTSGNILTKNIITANWNNAGAVSSNILPSNADGWMEFSASTSSHFIVGLAYNNAIHLTEFSAGIFIDYTTNSYSSYEGTTSTALGAFQGGDIFRISREGALVRYFKNGIEVRSVAVNPALVLKVKSSIKLNGKSTPSITTSFDCQLILQETNAGVDGSGGSGNISLNVSGGSAPYSYSWSSGEQGSSISNKPKGSYAVTVVDALGRVKNRTYSIGYKLNWVNQIGVNTNGGVLTKDNPTENWNNAGAVSSNILPLNANGWIEFSSVSKSDFIVGLAVNNVINSTEFTNGIYLEYSTSSWFAYEGTTTTALGNFQAGDVFRISREGSLVKYYKNGVEARSVAVNPALVLKTKATIKLNNRSTPNIVSSFDCQLILQETIVGLNGNSGSGSASLNVSGGTPPYNYSWSGGEQTSSISNKPKGSYSVTVIDAAGRVQNRTYAIGYKLNWVNQVGVVTNGSILTKNTPVENWNNAGGTSSSILSANTDGWMEFSTVSNSDFIVGLAVNNVINRNEFSYGIYVDHTTNNYFAYEAATSFLLGNWQAGDVFRVSREGNLVRYYRNGLVVRSVTTNPALLLKVKTSLKFNGRSTPNINTSFWFSDGAVRTYYAIADGLWTDPSIWALSEGGVPSTIYPDDIDNVVIKGYSVTVNSSIRIAGVIINAINNNTLLKVDGAMGSLTVKGNVVMNGEAGSNSAELLMVRNGGRLDVISP